MQSTVWFANKSFQPLDAQSPFAWLWLSVVQQKNWAAVRSASWRV